MRKTKILISTDSARIHTGLAETCRLVFRRLLEKYPNQYDVEQLGWFHFNAEKGEEVPWKIHQTHVKQGPDGSKEIDQADKYGQRSFESVRYKFNPDIVWTNGDLWCFDHVLNSPTRNTFRLCCYYTIDGTPYYGSKLERDKETEWGSKLAKSDRIAVLTEWGRDVLGALPELKNRQIDVVYHPVDIDRFKVYNREEKVKLRSQMYPPTMPHDAFVFGWVGRNQFRKMNFKMWEVMHYLKFGDYIECEDCGRITVKEWDHAKMESREVGKLMKYDADYDYSECAHCKSKNVKQGTPIEDVYLWLHMNRTDPGWNTNSMAQMYKVEDRITFTNGIQASKGLPPDVLAKLIGTWDGMMYLSGGEGFGIPAFESLMAGVPTIYTNYSSHADYCKHGGLPVRVDFIPELGLTIHRSIADTNHAVEQCLWAYRNQDKFAELGLKGRKFTETKTIDVIVDQWHQMFQEMMEKPLPIDSQEMIYAQNV